jgi:hypothetical protein
MVNFESSRGGVGPAKLVELNAEAAIARTQRAIEL